MTVEQSLQNSKRKWLSISIVHSVQISIKYKDVKRYFQISRSKSLFPKYAYWEATGECVKQKNNKREDKRSEKQENCKVKPQDDEWRK